MGRLIGKTNADVQKKRRDLAVKYARLSGAVVVLKGSETVVTDGTGVYTNQTGNAGMATAGSGDVLTGVIAALVGQGLPPFDAAKLGACLHGMAGDLGSAELGMHGLTASDIVRKLPTAFQHYAKLREGDMA
jgi:NAD(P)H-hydrate epimerase